MLRRIFIVVALIMGTLGFAKTASAEPKEIKFGTLAPKVSAWGKVFDGWATVVAAESNGALKLTWFMNGSKGDEGSMVGKIRSRELDGAAVTATGLASITPNISALQLPGLFPTWSKLDTVRDQLFQNSSEWSKLNPDQKKKSLTTEFNDQHFVILGKGDIGMAHIMSRDIAVRVPEDLKKGVPFYIKGDPIGQAVLEVVRTMGSDHALPALLELSVPKILPAVTSRDPGSVNIINSPAIAAAQLGWAPNMTHINTMVSGIGIGALVIHREFFEALPPDAQALLERTGKNTGALLTDRIRKMDEAAFKTATDTKIKVEATAAEQAQWDALFAKVRQKLKTETKIRADVFDAVVGAANAAK